MLSFNTSKIRIDFSLIAQCVSISQKDTYKNKKVEKWKRDKGD
jgi:hypothetical protein